MRKLLYALALLCLVTFTASANADTLFALKDVTFKSGATATGNITIDTVGGNFISADFTYQLGGFSAVFDAPFVDGGTVFDGQIFSYLFTVDDNLFLLDLPVTSLMDYAGGPICSDDTLCDDFRSYVELGFDPIDQFTTGSLVPLAATPEPSALMLLSTGLLAFPVVLRSRVERASRRACVTG